MNGEIFDVQKKNPKGGEIFIVIGNEEFVWSLVSNEPKSNSTPGFTQVGGIKTDFILDRWESVESFLYISTKLLTISSTVKPLRVNVPENQNLENLKK